MQPEFHAEKFYWNYRTIHQFQFLIQHPHPTPRLFHFVHLPPTLNVIITQNQYQWPSFLASLSFLSFSPSMSTERTSVQCERKKGAARRVLMIILCSFSWRQDPPNSASLLVASCARILLVSRAWTDRKPLLARIKQICMGTTTKKIYLCWVGEQAPPLIPCKPPRIWCKKRNTHVADDWLFAEWVDEWVVQFVMLIHNSIPFGMATVASRKGNERERKRKREEGGEEFGRCVCVCVCVRP